VATFLFCIRVNFTDITDPNGTAIRPQTNVLTKLTTRPQPHPYKNFQFIMGYNPITPCYVLLSRS